MLQDLDLSGASPAVASPSGPAARTAVTALPPLARAYVAATIGAGAIVLAICAPRITFSQPSLFIWLALLSILASGYKVRLPLTYGESTMSVSYVVDFTALLLLGPHETMLVAALSAWAQCTFNVTTGNPLHRTLFNIGAIVLTVQAAGLVFYWAGGVTGQLGLPDVANPLLAAATIYYLVNTGSIALAVALTGRLPVLRVWNDNFLWSAPSYFVGATVAMVSGTIVNGSSHWVLPLLTAPIYLTYRSYKVYLGRLEDEQKHRQQVSALHGQTLQALESAKESAAKHREALESLRKSEERYALAATGSNDGLWDWDIKGNEIYFSPRWKAMLGYEDHEIGISPGEWLKRVHPDENEGLRAALGAHLAGQTEYFEYEYRVLAKSGEYRWMLTRAAAVRDSAGYATRMAGSQTDITERRVAQARLEHAARHDALTELPNRALFVDALQRALARVRRHVDRRFAVLFLDLDRFKVINDSLGHTAGDQLLTKIAARLRTCLRTGDVLARFGGDEFTILLEDVAGIGDATFVVDRIQRALRDPFTVWEREAFVTASIGVALGTSEYDHPEELLRDADTAMYEAKVLGKARHVVFHPRMRQHAVARLTLETELRRAIEHQQLALHYQPVISLTKGSLVGFEALLRWQHSDGRLVPPNEFIPLAEETGMMVPLGGWVLREACHQAATWQRRYGGDAPLRMNVNISPRQLTHPDFVQTVREAVGRSSLIPGTLALEITEGALAADEVTAAAVVRDLKNLPVQVLLDDFGTGYSSLGHLHRFPVDGVKIDRSFQRRDELDSTASPIIAMVVTLAQQLGMGVIAEGIETSEQLEHLRRVQCHYAQGFYFSKAVAPEDAGALIALAKATPLPEIGRSVDESLVIPPGPGILSVH